MLEKFRMRNPASPAGGENPRAPWLVAIELNRLLAVMAIFELGLIGFLVVWHQLRPVKVIETVYVEFQTAANNFVVLHRAGGDVTTDQAVIAREARRYVAQREPVDKQTEEKRYPEVRELSCAKVWESFKSKYGAKDGPFLTEGFKREVRIMRDSRVADGVHQVEFETRDWIEGRTRQDDAKWVPWVALLSYKFEEGKKRLDKIATNPMGWQTCEYQVSKRSSE